MYRAISAKQYHRVVTRIDRFPPRERGIVRTLLTIHFVTEAGQKMESLGVSFFEFFE